MLFKQKYLEGIQAGTVTLAFRKWKKASATTGSLIKTAIGLVAIEDVVIVAKQQIKESDAHKAGFDTLAALVKMLDQYPEGDYYRIKVRYHGVDPRITLRGQKILQEEAYLALKTKLERLDQYSKTGHWTMEVLQAIRDNPKLRAADLAHQTLKTKEWLKLNIRKLKNLGLTISHDPGYEISPLGTLFLQRHNKDK